MAQQDVLEKAVHVDEEVDRLLSGINIRSFRTRDEQEVGGYAAAMELVFESWREVTLTGGPARSPVNDLRFCPGERVVAAPAAVLERLLFAIPCRLAFGPFVS